MVLTLISCVLIRHDTKALNAIVRYNKVVDYSKNMDIKITNVVTTADIKQSVDIVKFNDYPWGIYDNELYGGRCGYIKDNSMEGRVTVFYTGKLISTGAKSIEKSEEQLKRAIELMVNANLIRYLIF